MNRKNSLFKINNGEIVLLAPREAERYRGMTDEALCQAAREGDSQAAVFLVFHRNGSVLLKLVDRYAEGDCRERLLSELVSDVYFHFDRYGWEKAVPREVQKMRAYLYSVERHLLEKLRRKDFNERGACRNYSIDVMFEDGYSQPRDDPFSREEARDYVERLLSGLSETRRFVISKRYAEGYKSAEVARMLPAFWDSAGVHHPVESPTGAYVDNIVSRTARQLRACRD